MDISQELKNQIEAAFDYRGHVTVALTDGTSLEGFLYNRQYETKNGPTHFIELIPKNKDERKRLPMAGISSIALSGEDCAAGNSYADYLARQTAQASK